MQGREIVNIEANERIVFRVIAAESDGELLEMDDFWGHPEHEVGLHHHPTMEETWHVIAGSVEFVVGDREVFAGPGDIVVAPPGVRHSARNVGGPAHIRVQMRPALRWEEFVTQYFALENAPHETEAEFAELLVEYSTEIEI
ncbi:MAG: cupin domain-containing protein [Thermoleophilaceae bacterium]|nr:cupin domain-containing protein [Thermoleophilaceae bacterium]